MKKNRKIAIFLALLLCFLTIFDNFSGGGSDF